MELLYWTLIFISSLFVLIKAADYFILSVEQIGKKFALPAFILGATVVAFGTSLPELITSIVAVSQGSSEIVVGNVVGSNTSNIFFIIGFAIIALRKVEIQFEKLKYDFLILLISAALLSFFFWDGTFAFWEACLSIILMISYIIYVLRFHKSEMESELEVYEIKFSSHWFAYVIFIFSALLILLSAKFTVESIVELALLLNLGTEVIALSAVSLGTSLPELVVSLAAARKGLTDIVIGNIVGSNIFNTFAVMGIPYFFGIIKIPSNILDYSLPMMLIATLLFFILALKKNVRIYAGVILILFYVLFLSGLFLGWKFLSF